MIHAVIIEPFSEFTKDVTGAIARTRRYNGEMFKALTAIQFEQIEAWLKEQPISVVCVFSRLQGCGRNSM